MAAAAAAGSDVRSSRFKESSASRVASNGSASDKRVSISYKEAYERWISKFGKLTPLSGGSFGSVFAIDVFRVIKISPFNVGGSSERAIQISERIARKEIEIIRRLNAARVPHMVTCLDEFVEPGVKAAVVLGRDDRILRSFKSDFKGIRSIMRKHLEALVAMHDLGCGHFDLATVNITKDRVLDFGGSAYALPGTFLREIVTTLYYRSPEMFTGRRLFNIRAKSEDMTTHIDYLNLLKRFFGLNPEMIKGEHLRERYLMIDPNTGEVKLKKMSRYLEREKDFVTRIRECNLAKQESKEDLEQFIDLLTRMLQLNPEKRLSFKELLNHPFLSAYKEEEVNFHLDLSHLEIDRGKIHFISKGRDIAFADVHDSPLCVHLPKDSFPLDVHIYDALGKLVFAGMILGLKEGLRVNMQSYESQEVLSALGDSSSGVSSSDEERETA